jgi:hypothetical protein
MKDKEARRQIEKIKRVIQEDIDNILLYNGLINNGLIKNDPEYINYSIPIKWRKKINVENELKSIHEMFEVLLKTLNLKMVVIPEQPEKHEIHKITDKKL